MTASCAAVRASSFGTAAMVRCCVPLLFLKDDEVSELGSGRVELAIRGDFDKFRKLASLEMPRKQFTQANNGRVDLQTYLLCKSVRMQAKLQPAGCEWIARDGATATCRATCACGTHLHALQSLSHEMFYFPAMNVPGCNAEPQLLR